MSTKGNVLKALEENKGVTVSGEELAGRLNVSRAAIWKAIGELRKEGYPIDAITNKGYCLSSFSDLLSAEGISPHIAPSFHGCSIHVFKTVESTNLTAKKMALEGAPAGSVIIAEEQTKGRGRMGRNFYSPPSRGIYMSFILKPRFDASKAVLITTAASVAVCRAIEKVTGVSCFIKWVNDIYADGKKVCGILTEAVTDFETGQIEHIVLGIGINYSTASGEFPEELSEIAGSLFHSNPVSDGIPAVDVAQTGKGVPAEDEPSDPAPPSRNRLIAEVINQVLELNEALESRSFIEEYRRRSMVLGKEIRILTTGQAHESRDFTNGITAYAIDVDPDGGLMVRYEDGSSGTLNTGEVSIRPIG
ncbi:MAG: biotin--[acetyl-CoA-carboxylase] ligase [Bacillota bacterium]|jgi:BirA family biotin operon repressor/biotin-[acetyl-CoA-carboxylase] ligase|nr:biotin--[acetyl-CoA-carboxylase] ligase [Bacillota bacterium]